MVYRFEFYLRQQQAQGGDDAAEQQFKHVELTLPPPSADPRGADFLSGTVRKALGRLLAACGLRSDLQVRWGGQCCAAVVLVLLLWCGQYYLAPCPLYYLAPCPLYYLAPCPLYYLAPCPQRRYLPCTGSTAGRAAACCVC